MKKLMIICLMAAVSACGCRQPYPSEERLRSDYCNRVWSEGEEKEPGNSEFCAGLFPAQSVKTRLLPNGECFFMYSDTGETETKPCFEEDMQ